MSWACIRDKYGGVGGQKGHMSEKCAYTLIIPTTVIGLAAERNVALGKQAFVGRR